MKATTLYIKINFNRTWGSQKELLVQFCEKVNICIIRCCIDKSFDELETTLVYL